MKPTPWLQELRDLLSIDDDETRRAAMMTWEGRWLLDLHARVAISAREMVQSQVNPLAQAHERIRHELGRCLADIMVDITSERMVEPNEWDESIMDVRGYVLAIRREPS